MSASDQASRIDTAAIKPASSAVSNIYPDNLVSLPITTLIRPVLLRRTALPNAQPSFKTNSAVMHPSPTRLSHRLFRNIYDSSIAFPALMLASQSVRLLSLLHHEPSNCRTIRCSNCRCHSTDDPLFDRPPSDFSDHRFVTRLREPGIQFNKSSQISEKSNTCSRVLPG